MAGPGFTQWYRPNDAWRSSSASVAAAQSITLVGVTVANLDDADAVQLPLPFGPDRSADLDRAVDAVRERFAGGLIGPES